MIAQLNGNPLGKALALFCGGMVAVLVGLGVIWALPPAGSDAAESEGGSSLSSNVPQLSSAEPIENYAVITDRPVFNESRQPVIGAADDEEGEEDLAAMENVDAPDVELAGVVITPEMRVATLRLKDSPESLLAFEGQPLEGNFGSWRVSRIEARTAILESDSGEQVRLDLQIHDAVIDEPPKPASNDQAQVNSENGGQPEQEVDPTLTRAEEIRQRIAQRREELKRAAEEGQQPENITPQVDYREAIQAMMAGQKKQEDDDKEQ